MKKAQRHIPPSYIRECFDVDQLGILVWKVRPASHFKNPHNFVHQRFAGLRAGRINIHGYYMVSLTHEGRVYKVLNHRIVWLLTHGDWPVQYIDHINRVRTDNSPANLRDVSHEVNMSNACRGPGVLAAGAYRSKGGAYRSQVQFGGRIHYIGTFATSEEAHEAFVAKRAELRASA